MHLEDSQLVVMRASNAIKKPLLKFNSAQTQLSNSFLVYQHRHTDPIIVFTLCYREEKAPNAAAWTLRRYEYDEKWIKALTAVLL